MKTPSLSSNPPEKITWRVILLLLLLVPFLYRWHLYSEAIHRGFPTLVVPFYSVLFTLLILAVLNLPLKKFVAKHALTSGELISLYVFMSMTALFLSYDMFLPLVSTIVHAYYFATPENEWRELFWKYLPNWLTISDPDVLHAFYRGEQQFLQWRYLRVWLKPIFWWCSFTFVLIFVMQCINTIIRKQWAEQERLVYPVVELPYQISYNTGAFLRNKPMWWGFAIAGAISLLNGIHVLYPLIPGIPNKGIPLTGLFTEKPWTALLRGSNSIVIYPFAVGLFFLMPLSSTDVNHPLFLCLQAAVLR